MTDQKSAASGRLAVPVERTRFRQLLAANPNYFGNLAESKLTAISQISGDVGYEELSCIGYNPALSLLEATVQIKRPVGYEGTLCFPGSTEYVRFFVDYGAGWVDGGVTSFRAHDIPDSTDCAKHPDKPLTYVATLRLQPQRRACADPVLPRVRGILSWQLVPPAGNPNWNPIWGNHLDRNIQISPRPFWLGDIIGLVPKNALAKLPPHLIEAGPIPIPLPDPPPLTLKEILTLHGAGQTGASAPVDLHRAAFPHVQALLGSADQAAFATASSEWKDIGLDIEKILGALDQTKADVSYEELNCLGLEYNLDRLVATFRIKRASGYSGGPCTHGSTEYVAFWADWDDTCKWSYLGTVQVRVHDYSPIPGGGLAYSVILPVDLSAVRRSCTNPKISRIRAVLSWNLAPSTVDPDELKHWGNRLDAHVQIRPGAAGVPNEPTMSVIGGIGVADIHVLSDGMTSPAATFAFGGGPADAWGLGRPCPFGGLVIVQGPPILGHKYRLWARKFNDPMSETVVRDTFHIVNWLGTGSFVTPDINGYAPYRDTLANLDQVLAHWSPPGDELWEIRLELATLGGTVIGSTIWHRIQVDNTAPRRRPASAPFEPPDVACEIHIDSGGDCKDFNVATVIQGHFVARDLHFGGFKLTTLPSSMAPNPPTTGTPGTSQTGTFASGGDVWQLNTSGMKPCGYVVLLEVWDRTIVNSVPGQHNHNFFDVGFCLR